MIDLSLHQIWIGPRKRPVEWMETWREMNEDMLYYLWDERKIANFGLKNRATYDYYMEKGLYAGAADVARVEILERYGGVYTDADSIALQPIEHEWFMQLDFFVGYEYDQRFANGVIGAKAGHPILQDYIKRIGESKILLPPQYTIGGTLLTSCVDHYRALHPVESMSLGLLHANNFYPKWKHRGEIKEKIYSRQMWGTTKGLYE